MKRVRRDGSPETYHRLRIAGKRFRYALEFLADVYPGETKPLVRLTVALQDVLGRYQDAHVAIERLRELAAERGDELGPGTVFAMGEIAERYRTEAEETRRRVAPAYKRLRGKELTRLRKQMDDLRPPEAAPPVEPPS